MHLTSHITHSNGYAPYIAYYRSNGVDQLFRKLKPKPKLNPPNAHRSQIKICEYRQTQNVQFPFMPNAFRILKPIQKSSKRVWVFRNTGANAFAQNQMRLAYEDKRDLYCHGTTTGSHMETIIAEPAGHGSPRTYMDETRATVVDKVPLASDEILKMIKCPCESDMPCKSKRYECHNANMTCTVCYACVSVRTPESTFR